ncbi:chemotaxis protein CheZ [Azospirillaceae bacterium]
MSRVPSPFYGDRPFRHSLEVARVEASRPLSREEVSEVIRQIVGSLSGDLSATDLYLYGELEGLMRYIQTAREEIAALRPQEIRDSQLPVATDELDAVVHATEVATNLIMDAGEEIQKLAEKISDVVGDDVAKSLIVQATRIFEACNFQDLTGQRIQKVVRTLHSVEKRVEDLVSAFGEQADFVAKKAEAFSQAGGAICYEGDSGEENRLLHGPQRPGAAIDQREIDRLLASFD